VTWAKGQSGNPKGAPRRSASLSTALTLILRAKGPDGQPNRDAIAQRLVAMALSGNLDAIKLIFDRIEGPVSAVVPDTNPRGQVVPFNVTIDRPSERAS
jgi:hypothetical protein